MRKYNNYNKFLSSIDFKLETTPEDFISTNNMIFECSLGHKTTITGTSFANKKVLCKNNYKFLCTTCKKDHDNNIMFNKYSEEVVKNGHVLITLNSDTRKCSYKCGNCGEIKYTYIQNIRKESNSIYCSSCIQISNKLNIEDVNLILNNFDYKCIEYENNKKLKVQCDKNHLITSLSLFDYKRGRRCPFCFNKTEEKVFKFLNEFYNVKYQFTPDWCINPKTGRCLRYDFLLNDYKIIIELDGVQHFEQVMNWEPPDTTRNTDVFKMNKAVENSHHLIRLFQKDIWYDKYDWKTYLKSKIEYLIENYKDKYICIFPEERDDEKYMYKKHIDEYNKSQI